MKNRGQAAAQSCASDGAYPVREARGGVGEQRVQARGQINRAEGELGRELLHVLKDRVRRAVEREVRGQLLCDYGAANHHEVQKPEQAAEDRQTRPGGEQHRRQHRALRARRQPLVSSEQGEREQRPQKQARRNRRRQRHQGRQRRQRKKTKRAPLRQTSASCEADRE